jgi:hypothetical protein
VNRQLDLQRRSDSRDHLRGRWAGGEQPGCRRRRRNGGGRMVAASEGGDEERAEPDQGDCSEDGEAATVRLLLSTTVPKGSRACTP